MCYFNKIDLLFGLCIVVRLFVALLVQSLTNKNIQKLFALIFLTVSFGFFYNYFIQKRKYGALGQIAWWDYMRPIHSSLYLLASYLLYNGKHILSSRILLLDAVIGLISYILHHKI